MLQNHPNKCQVLVGINKLYKKMPLERNSWRSEFWELFASMRQSWKCTKNYTINNFCFCISPCHKECFIITAESWAIALLEEKFQILAITLWWPKYLLPVTWWKICKTVIFFCSEITQSEGNRTDTYKLILDHHTAGTWSKNKVLSSNCSLIFVCLTWKIKP